MITPAFQPGDRAVCILRSGERELKFGQTYYVFDVVHSEPQHIIIDDNVLCEGRNDDILICNQPEVRSWPAYKFHRVVALCDKGLK